MQPIVIDLETRSACDLKEEGSWKYAKHPTTRLLTVAWCDGEDYHVWLPGLQHAPPDSFVRLHLPNVQVWFGDTIPAALCRCSGRPWAGHNVWTFDRLVWEECTESVRPSEWVDTYPLALAGGLPGGLSAIGNILWGEGKYEAGKDALKKASRCTGEDDCEPENVPLGQLMLVAKYNVQDVKLTKQLLEKLQAETHFTNHEIRVKAAHDVVNNRGIRIDRPLVVALVGLADQARDAAIGQISEYTAGALPDRAAVQSRKRVLDWLDSQGFSNFKVSGLRKDIVARFIDHNRSHRDAEDDTETFDDTDAFDDPNAEPTLAERNMLRVLKVLELRMQAMRITGGKLETALAAMDLDHRIRHWCVYWGAHTGRWAARRIQPHNLPRPKEGVDTWAMIDLFHREGRLEYDAVAGLLPLGLRGADGKLLYPYLSVDDAASALLRGIFLPDVGDVLAAADLANIEARVLAWCAGEEWLMASFWAGDDPYMQMAVRIFGPTETWPQFPDPKTGKPLSLKKHPYRQVGKVVVLGSGYQLGAMKFSSYAAGMGIDLSVVDTTAAACIKAYRCAHPAIAGTYEGDRDDGRPIFRGGLWTDLNNAVVLAIESRCKTYAGRCTFHMEGTSLICTLPSGRRLTYRKAELDDVKDSVPWDSNGRSVWAATYWSPRYGRKYLYGGSIAENIVQAISRDVLANGLVLLEDACIPVVLHVHDELASSTKEDRYPEFMKCVTTCPDWLDGFPLDAEGGLSPRYSKSPPPGVKEQVWRNGVYLKSA